MWTSETPGVCLFYLFYYGSDRLSNAKNKQDQPTKRSATHLGGDGRDGLARGEGGAVPDGEDVGVRGVAERELVHVDVALCVRLTCVRVIGGQHERARLGLTASAPRVGAPPRPCMHMHA